MPDLDEKVEVRRLLPEAANWAGDGKDGSPEISAV
jgi:hypothetical protein